MRPASSTSPTLRFRIPGSVFRVWKRVASPGRRLEDRIVHLFVALLMAIQLASFLCMRWAIDEAANRSVRQELHVGARVLERLLQNQGQQLQEAAKVLSADSGFREAVATRDRKTVLSALENHAAPFKASRMVLVGLDGRIVADSGRPGNAGRVFAHPSLVPAAADAERGPAIRVLDGKPYQVVAMPMKTPNTTAWVVLMLAIDDAMARDLERLVNAGVVFVVQDGASIRVVATTLGEAGHQALSAPLTAMVREHRGEAKAEGHGASYQMLSRRLDESGAQRIDAVLLRATEDAVFPYRVLELTALLLTAIALALTLAGAMRIARRISRPVEKLGAVAREIADGNYRARAGSGGRGEMADLSKSLNHMAHGLMERDLMRTRLGRMREQRDDLQRITGDLAVLAARDPLTGLANRRTLELHLAGWDAEGRSIAMLMIDIDHFKEINDQHSHIVGDHVLQVVAGLMRASCRTPDLAARYGGDEFLIAVANPESGSAAAVAERLRSAVALRPWHEVAPGLRVTVSIGVAEAHKGLEASEAVKQADAALHAAKREGRNRVKSSTGSWLTV
jgi:diguanylate cyclase (GGDEF)-like protein